MKNTTLDCTYCHKVLDVNEMWSSDHCSKECYEKERKSIEFNDLTRPLIKYINDNYDPHTKIIIETTSAELVSGIIGTYTEEHIRD